MWFIFFLGSFLIDAKPIINEKFGIMKNFKFASSK